MRRPKKVVCLYCRASTFTSEGILVAHLTLDKTRCPGKWRPNTREARERALEEGHGA